MKKVAGSYQETSAKIGFHEWNLDAVDEFKEFIGRIVQEGLKLATKEYECRAWFPREWSTGDGANGPTPDDPTTIYVELPIGPEEYDSPRWTFRLSDLVDSVIQLHEMGEGGPIEEDCRPVIEIRDGLKMLVERLDAALARK